MEFKPDACQNQYKYLLCIFNRCLIYVQNTNSILNKFLFLDTTVCSRFLIFLKISIILKNGNPPNSNTSSNSK